MSLPVTIYMPLLNEGTDVWAPVVAEQIGPMLYRLTGLASADQDWQFGDTGQMVRVESRAFSSVEVGLAVVALESA